MNWKKVKLGEICQNLDGKRKPLNNIERQKIRGNGKYPYFGANNIMDWVDEYIFDEKILCIAEDGGSWGASQKCCFIYAGKCWVNNHAHVLKAKEGVSTEFLMYYLNFSDLNSYITGSTRGKLTKSSLDGIKIPLPDLATQKHIAEVLDKADALRQQNRQLLANYDELLQSTFIELFGNPVKNPKGWEVKKLGEVTDISSGATPSREKVEYYQGSIPWVKTTEVNGTKILETEEYISEDALKNTSCKLYPEGSVIIAMYGQGKTRGQVGILGIKATTNQACGVILPCKSFIPQYLFQSLKFSYNFLRDLSRGGNQPNLNGGIIKNLEVTVPPLPLQQHFAKIVEQIEAQKAQAQAALAESEALFEGLLAGYFNA